MLNIIYIESIGFSVRNRAVLFDSFSCRHSYYPLSLHISSGTFFAFWTFLVIWGFYFYFHFLLTVYCATVWRFLLFLAIFVIIKSWNCLCWEGLFKGYRTHPPCEQWAVTFSSRSRWDLCLDLKCLWCWERRKEPTVSGDHKV